MQHQCTRQTDLDELIGTERWDNQRLAFHYGPLPLAMTAGEELVLKGSAELSLFLLAKLRFVTRSLQITETDQVIRPHPGFHITFN